MNKTINVRIVITFCCNFKEKFTVNIRILLPYLDLYIQGIEGIE
jgi:hypothetical protein